MIGHKWEQAEGTVLHRSVADVGIAVQHGGSILEVYDVEVRMPDGTTDRAQVPSDQFRHFNPGTVLLLEVNAKTKEVRLHSRAQQLVVGFNTSVAVANEDDFGTSAATPAIDYQASPQVQVLGGEQAAEVLRSVLGGDVTDPSALKERLRQLAGGNVAGVQVTTSTVYGGTGLGQPGGFGQPTAADRPSPSQRIAVLQEMLDRGQLSQAEFDAKRQQILDQI
jgi:hypothetical protein